MRTRRGRPAASWLIGAAAIGFVAGVIVTSAPAIPAAAQAPVAERPPSVAPPAVAAEAIDDLRTRHLTLPVEGLERQSLRDTFSEERGTGRRHEALDILAPRDTPVRAVEDGTIARLFLSVPGGITVYQFDPGSTYAYYYAHLARYAEGLKEGAAVARGQTIGYVGTTGNAPPDTPHLHFAIFKLTDEKRWWRGMAIDPYPVFK